MTFRPRPIFVAHGASRDTLLLLAPVVATPVGVSPAGVDWELPDWWWLMYAAASH